MEGLGRYDHYVRVASSHALHCAAIVRETTSPTRVCMYERMLFFVRCKNSDHATFTLTTPCNLNFLLITRCCLKLLDRAVQKTKILN